MNVGVQARVVASMVATRIRKRMADTRCNMRGRAASGEEYGAEYERFPNTLRANIASAVWLL